MGGGDGLQGVWDKGDVCLAIRMHDPARATIRRAEPSLHSAYVSREVARRGCTNDPEGRYGTQKGDHRGAVYRDCAGEDSVPEDCAGESEGGGREPGELG